ncbi:MAG: CoA-acylating methylmalonate-semialdehyde dehydrogenase [Planctomycetes bacterium]|nr:CoA-acylating methylmalonate-semialdehyde dehydrogenase [Planctomycetota bacterium]
MPADILRNFIGGEWVAAAAGAATREVRNPATEQLLGHVPLGGEREVAAAVAAARAAFPAWRQVPPVERARYLFAFKRLLDEHAEQLAEVVTREHGKTLAEARGSVQRGIECVEVACGAPSLMMGYALEDVARGIDCEAVRQPLGVFACIAPFNFPAMVPLWFFPFAVACGNTFVCKPSEQVPLSQQLIFELAAQAGFPAGVLNLVHGGRETVEAICAHPEIRGVSFVGSSPVAELVYRAAAMHGKRVQALGGAKNFMVVMPDADRPKTVAALAGSAFGCAGERCLAGSVVLAVGGSHEWLRTGLREAAQAVVVGDGTAPDVTMGPLVSKAHLERVRDYVERGVAEGAELLVDGRAAQLPARGWFLGPCLFDRVTREMVVAREEIFGPVLCLASVPDLDAALAWIATHPLANASSIFTDSGSAARRFKYEVEASMAAVNIGVPAPMSFFGFGGAKGSFFGDLKAHGREAFDFYTDRKVLISRWT